MKYFILAILLISVSCLSENVTIKVGQNYTGSSPMPFAITASCQATLTGGSSSQLCGVLTTGTGSVNGQNLPDNKQFCLTINNGQTYNVNAGASAGGWAINQGPATIELSCNINLDEALQLLRIDVPAVDEKLGINENVSIKVNQNYSGSSPMPFAVTATCTSTVTGGSSAQLCGMLTAGSGNQINGQNIPDNQKFCFTVTNGQTYKISAGASAGGWAINSGPATIDLACSINLEEEVQTPKRLGITKVIQIATNKNYSGSDPLPFTISGSCVATTLTGGSSAKICGMITAGGGEINGQNMPVDQNTCFTITQGEKLTISADGNSAGWAINQGPANVTATCDANLEQLQVEEQRLGISKNITININQNYSGSDPMPFPIQGSCSISLTGGSSAQICGVLTQGSGSSINGQAITLNQQFCYTVSNGENLSIDAGADAAGWAINHGPAVINADCTANLQTLRNIKRASNSLRGGKN